MASRYYDGASSSSSTDDEASEAEGNALQKAYCDAITKLLPNIIPVLTSEIKVVLSKAYSEGLVGENMYSTGITLQGNPREKTEQFLMIVKGQINTKLEFYHVFLKILRNTEAIQHIADILEKEVNSIQKRRAKPKRLSKRAKKNRKEASSKCVHESHSTTSGFQSDFSTAQSADTLQTPEQNQEPNSSNADGGSTDALAGSVPHETNSTFFQSTGNSPVARFFIPGNGEATQESTHEENRTFKEEEKIGDSIEESSHYMQHATPTSGASVVYSGTVTEGYDVIQRVVEHEKTKAQMVISEKDGYVRLLQKQIASMESEKMEERNRLEEKIRRKEAELQQSRAGIKQKDEEIDCLKKARKADATRIQKLENEKASLERDKIQAEKDIEVLKLELKHKDEVAALKERVQALECEKIERDTQARMQAQVEAKINEVKAAEDDIRTMIKKHDQKLELVLQQTVQRSVSSSSGMSSVSNADSGISPSLSSTSTGVEIEVEEKLCLSVTQMNLTSTRKTNISGISTPDESILEPLEEEP